MNEKGKVIGQAIDIMRKTYKEIDRLKADLKELVSDIDSKITSEEQYSYGPKSLNLKSYYIYLLTRNEDIENIELNNQKVFAIVCIFYDDGYIDRIVIKDEPEIWFVLFEINDRNERINIGDIQNLFIKENSKHFKGEVKLDGSIIDYIQEVESKDKRIYNRSGKFIGYPLADISDKNFLNDNVIKKLFTE